MNNMEFITDVDNEAAELLRQQEEARIQAEIRRRRYEELGRQREALSRLRGSIEDALSELYRIRNEMLYVAGYRPE